MSSSTKASDRSLSNWFNQIESGRLVLPSFQRNEAWDAGRIRSMLSMIVRDLPLGVALVLEVGDREKFVSRPLATAPHTSDRPYEQLLDGQQRLTSLWRALHNNYGNISYLLHVPVLDNDPSNDDNGYSVWSYSRWMRQDRVMPLWIDDPRQCLERGMIPFQLLAPDADAAALTWADHATAHLMPARNESDASVLRAQFEELQRVREQLKVDVLQPLRETVKNYNLPFLLLDASTPKDVALDVFIKMNTNSKPLGTFDVIVAEVESATREHLHQKLASLEEAVPGIGRYGDLRELVLQTSALLQGRVPSSRGELEMDKATMMENWAVLTNGLSRLVVLLESQKIFDAKHLPSAVPLPLIAALYALVPAHGDEVANAETLFRAYLWSAFFTSRYENAAATRALADYRDLVPALETVMAGQVSTLPNEPTIFDRAQYPLPSVEELIVADWPKKKRTLSRAILAASLRFGALDFADAHEISATNVAKREYHHLFPDKLLRDANINSFLALNCALITWKTNRDIGRLDPIRYLEARADASIGDSDDIAYRLQSHLVPYFPLAEAGPYDSVEGEALTSAVRPAFENFLEQRAGVVHEAMAALCSGRSPAIEKIFKNVAGPAATEQL